MNKKDQIFKRHWKRIVILILFIVLLIASLFMGILEGVTIQALVEGDEIVRRIFIHSRLPRTMAVVLTGSGLSVAGLIMQAISRNKFMSPSTAGTTDAAILGLLIAFIFLGNQSGMVQTIFAFFFALFATTVFTGIISRLKIRETVYIPLLGMMYGGMIAALTTAIAFSFDALNMLNQFNRANFARIGGFRMIFIIVIPLVLAVIFATKFSIIGLGEDFSKNLGVNYNRVVMLGLFLVALISTVVLVTVGPLPFVGLIIPNIVTSFYGDNLKKSIFDLMLFGSVFVLICDIISQLIIFPFEMDVSLTVSLAGGIIFMIYLVRRMRGGGTHKQAKV